MQGLNFITGAALLIVAGSMAAVVSLRPLAQEDAARAEAGTQGARPGRGVGDRSRAGDRQAPPPDHGRGSPAQAGPAEAPRRFTVGVLQGHPDAADLAPKAARVEQFANQRLDQLTAQLDLTAAQRRKLFPILARTSDSYHPAMRIAGVAGVAPALGAAAGDAALNEVLKPAQQDRLVEHAITDAILWQEIIAGLQRQLDAQTPQLPEDGAPPPAPEPPPRRNLSDVAEPPR